MCFTMLLEDNTIMFIIRKARRGARQLLHETESDHGNKLIPSIDEEALQVPPDNFMVHCPCADISSGTLLIP